MINVRKIYVTINFHCLRSGLGSANWCFYSNVECFFLYLLASILGKFEFQYPYSRFVDRIICSAFRLAMSQKKAQTYLSPKKSPVSAAVVSQHACFYSYYAPSEFLSPCLLHHWAMWPFPQWNLILLLYAQECFSPGEWQYKFTVLWLFLKCTTFCPGFLTVKHSMRHTKFGTHPFSWNRH